MLAVIRFTFSKDLKFIVSVIDIHHTLKVPTTMWQRGKVCKPYNSVLGEHFRSHWDVIPVTYPSNPLEAPIHHQYLTESTRPAPRRISESSASIKSSKSARGPGLSAPSLKSLGTRSSKTLPNVNEALIESNAGAAASELSLAITGTSDEGAVVEGAGPEDAERVRVIYMTEQVSHHPPISSFHVACPARGIEGGGMDQISAKVSGTAIRVSPGPFNKGIFVRITDGDARGETYQVTHPAAYVNGVLRGSFYVTVSDCTIITCEGGQPGEKLRTIIEYKEEVRIAFFPMLFLRFLTSLYFSRGLGKRTLRWKVSSTSSNLARPRTKSGRASNTYQRIRWWRSSTAPGEASYDGNAPPRQMPTTPRSSISANYSSSPSRSGP